MRISVCNFGSVAYPQKYEREKKKKKKTGDGQDSASKAHHPPNTHQLTQSVRQGNHRRLP